MNLKLTHSLRKTQYLEFEEIIRSLTSQGAKRNLHNRTQIFYGQVDKKLHTHQKRRGCPFLPTPEKILFNFCFYEIWLAVNVKYPLPLISQLCSRGQKRGSFLIGFQLLNFEQVGTVTLARAKKN